MLTTHDERSRYRKLFIGLVLIIFGAVAISWWGNRSRKCYADLTAHQGFILGDDIKQSAASGSVRLTLLCEGGEAIILVTPKYGSGNLKEKI